METKGKNVTVPGYMPCLGDSLYKLQQDDILCDVQLIGEDGCVNAHTSVLCAACPYFKQLLISQNMDENLKTIHLHRTKLVELHNLIQLLYTGQVYISPVNMPKITILLENIQMQDVLQQIITECFFKSKPVDNIQKESSLDSTKREISCDINNADTDRSIVRNSLESSNFVSCSNTSSSKREYRKIPGSPILNFSALSSQKKINHIIRQINNETRTRVMSSTPSHSGGNSARIFDETSSDKLYFQSSTVNTDQSSHVGSSYLHSSEINQRTTNESNNETSHMYLQQDDSLDIENSEIDNVDSDDDVVLLGEEWQGDDSFYSNDGCHDNYDDGVEFDIQDVCARCLEMCTKWKISHRFMAVNILGCNSSGTVDSLIKKSTSKTWAELTDRGRQPYIAMKRFLEDPYFQEEIRQKLHNEHSNKKKPGPKRLVTYKRGEQFSTLDLTVLCKMFQKNPKPSFAILELLAAGLNTTLFRVRTWFNNQRAREFDANKVLEREKLFSGVHHMQSIEEKANDIIENVFNSL